ncbi:MAG: DNA mismatch repair protein MutS [Candidatus Dojkabacteria bacterium]|nr:DNA mismatch repair protein MutS [Candidatus Dojkabacteria bacterium]
MSASTTPMMRQYQHLKQQYPDKVLLFRMGDFYETFGDDAEITARVLNIALTSRDKKDDPTPLAGFPHHAVDQYLPKLVKAGYHVAVAEQVEDPKTAKGIVRREITRIVTPGTLTGTSSDEDTKTVFIASLFQNKKTFGVALCDLSTGAFKVTETRSRALLSAEIGRMNPAEILIPPQQDFSFLSEYSLNVNENFSYRYEQASSVLTSHFNVNSLASFGILPYQEAIIAAGALITYLTETQKSELRHISRALYYSLSGTMVLDRATIKNLELIDSGSDRGPSASLFKILDRTVTGMGSRKLFSWVLNPLLDHSEIQKRLDIVEFFFKNPDKLSHLHDMLKHVSDLERIAGRIGLMRTTARDLLNLETSLSTALDIAGRLSAEPELVPMLTSISDNATSAKNVISTISESIHENPPLAITEGGIIKDGFDKEIDRVRREASGSTDWIKNLEEEERKRTGISSLKVRMNKVFGYYIEITHTHKDKVPDHYIRKQTLVNSERYITPEMKEKEEIIMHAQEILSRLEYDCFQNVINRLLEHIEEIQTIADTIGTIDALASLAETARINDYTRPDVVKIGEKEGILEIRDSRHPIVERSTPEEFIQNDLFMNTVSDRLIVLTGPNMSGKSTFIRQMALIVLMAQIGSFVPASHAHISMVDRIFTRVGASDDLAGGRSTFMVEMDEAANILNNATKNSFIVLDEVGRGTSTYDGVSIAWAIAEHLHSVTGARCLFATHYHELLKLEDDLQAVKNYHVAVHEENDDVLFLRKIERGGTDRSYGIHVARMAGLPQNVITRAREILDGFEQENMFAVRNELKRDDTPKAGTKEENAENSTDTSPQLSFIDSHLSSTIPNLFNELKDVDINTITPVEAHRLIEKWKKQLGV